MAEVPFDWNGFQTALSELGQHLNELKFVDDAFDFLMSGAQQQPYALVTHKIGSTFPFVIVSSPPEPGLENGVGLNTVQEVAHLQDLATTCALWGYAEMADVRDRCDLVVKAVLEDFDQAAHQLLTLASTVDADNEIQKGRSGFGLTADKWGGNSAIAFRRNFVDPFGTVVDNHALALAQAAATVAAARVVVLGCQNSLMNIVCTYRDGAHDQLGKRAADQRHSVISAGQLTVVGHTVGVVGVLAGLTGAGAPITAALSLASTALSIAATQVPAEDTSLKDVTIAEAPDIMSDVIARVMEVRATFLQQLNLVGMAAGDVMANVAADEADGVLFPPRPLLDAASPETFHHQSSKQYD